MEKQVGSLSRKLIVNPSLQITFLFYSLALCLWITVASIILQLLASGYFRIGNISGTYILVFGVFVLVTGTAVIGGFFLSNRIAGPMFRLSRHMNEVAEGRVCETIAFREKDYFAEIIGPYNKILDELKELRKSV